MLNNTDSVLKKGEVEGAIQDYEALFAGARTEVCYPSVPPVLHSKEVFHGSGGLVNDSDGRIEKKEGCS